MCRGKDCVSPPFGGVPADGGVVPLDPPPQLLNMIIVPLKMQSRTANVKERELFIISHHWSHEYGSILASNITQ